MSKLLMKLFLGLGLPLLAYTGPRDVSAQPRFVFFWVALGLVVVGVGLTWWREWVEMRAWRQRRKRQLRIVTEARIREQRRRDLVKTLASGEL